MEEILKDSNSLNSLRMIVSVPVYKEYDNSNIFRLIDSLTKQNTEMSTFAVLFIVNNTLKDSSEVSPGYRENKKTLDMLSWLKYGYPELSNDIKTNLYRIAVVEKAKKIGLRIEYIDLSSQGVEKNIGKIRDLGLQYAEKIFKDSSDGDQGVVAQFDSDTIMESNYIKKSLDRFEKGKDALFVNLSYGLVDGSEEVFKTSFHHQFNILKDQFYEIIFSDSISVGGPQTMATLQAYKKIGGIEHQDMAEDFALSNSLMKNGNYAFGNNITVYTSDRARIEGYDAGMRLDKIESGEDYEIVFNHPKFLSLRRELQNLASNEKVIDEKVFKEKFNKYGFDYNEDIFKKTVLEREVSLKGRRNLLYKKIGLFLRDYFKESGIDIFHFDFFEEMKSFLEEQSNQFEIDKLNDCIRISLLKQRVRLNTNRDIVKYVLQNIFKSLKLESYDGESLRNFLDKIINSKQKEFLYSNIRIEKYITTLLEKCISYEEAFDKALEDFPDYLGEFKTNKMRNYLAMLEGLTVFLRSVVNSPLEYPNISQFLINMKSVE